MSEKYTTLQNDTLTALIDSPYGWNQLGMELSNEYVETLNQVDAAVKEMIADLNLEDLSSESSLDQKEAALMKVFTELSFSGENDIKILDEKRASSGQTLGDLRIEDVKRSLIDHRAVCSSDAAALTYIANSMGIECYDVTIGCQDKGGMSEVRQFNVYRLSDEDELRMCDVTQSRTYNQPIFNYPAKIYLDVMDRDNLKPRYIFSVDKMRMISDPSDRSFNELAQERVPAIATKGNFYSEEERL